MISNLPIALSSHTACFICREKNRSLYKVKKQDVIHAYVNHRIFIKHHARHCDAHFGENGLIRKEEFFCIPTRNLPLSLETVKMFDMLANNSSSIFSQFKDMTYLEDEHCKKITGWTKDEFTRFSLCITSIWNTKNRSKEELIALYRYWLRTGIDQTSLASLFSKDTTQSEISNYLEQIRDAIKKDFVPHFLGAKKKRDFFLRFNTVMTHKLYDLQVDDLVVVADGTYCRIEKSSNNDFQYKTFSQQKNQSLFKPFIICCADGYIVDCYGPFAANLNDAGILDYILDKDMDLTAILIPNKTTFVLDRGFRDSVKNLTERKLNPKIPTCVQLEDQKSKQLTVEQANNSRLVTKCRFIVEKKLGQIKNHLALDDRRNSEAGRLMIDYRNVCAMLNYFHKPCGADGSKAEKIGQRLKEKCENVKNNYLLHLLKINFNSNMRLADIMDFPRLSVAKMVGGIFYGSYYIRQCKSYLADLIKSGTYSSFSQTAFQSSNLSKEHRKDFFQQLESTRIVGMKLISRHKRSLKDKTKKVEMEDDHIKQFRESYKVFIQYRPNLMSTKAIIAYICSCKSGRKQAGCCVHVAVLIYYLSYAKYREHALRLPGEYLNSVLVDITQGDSPNMPRRVRNKRHKRVHSASESSDSDDDDDDMNDAPKNKNDNGTPMGDEQNKSNDTPLDDNQNETRDTPVDDNQNESSVTHDDINILDFEIHIPKWSANIIYKGCEVRVNNTCTIDYILFALWVLYRRLPTFLDDLPGSELTEKIKKIVENIEELKWNTAKQIWIVDVMKYSKKPIRKEISLFGTEHGGFVKHLIIYQTYRIREVCGCSNVNIINEEARELYFEKTDFGVQLLTSVPTICEQCQQEKSEKVEFKTTPSILLIQSVTNNITLDEIPVMIQIDHHNFHLLCSTLHIRDHFVCVFLLNGQKYLVNDLQQKPIILPQYSMLPQRTRNKHSSYFNQNTGTSIYFLKK